MSIIEAQTNKKKKLWLKTIAFFVAFVFLFQQIGIADVYNYRRSSEVAHGLLPTVQEHDQSSRFAPDYLKMQQSKHEMLLRQRKSKEDLMGQIFRRPRETEEPLPLKKKQSTGPGGGGPVEYTMTGLDDIDDPHQLNDLITNENDALTSIKTFDVTRQTGLNWLFWGQDAEWTQNEETGEEYYIGFEDKEYPEAQYLLRKTMYTGEKDSEKIDYVLSGYVLDPTSPVEAREYNPVYRTDYIYDGDDVKQTLRYYVRGLDEPEQGGILAEESLFEGSGDNNRIATRIVYNKETGKVESRQDFIYVDADGQPYVEGQGQEKVLKEVRSYSTQDISDQDLAKEEGQGLLRSVTYYTGDAGEEIQDYTYTYRGDTAGSETVATTMVTYYKGGKRAEEASPEDPQEKVVTYNIEIDMEDPAATQDADGDGIFDNYENNVTSIAYYHTEHRLADEQVLDYTETYSNGEVVQETVFYYGEEEVRASEATATMPMSKSVAYWGDAVDEDGNIKEDARIRSATYYYIVGRLKGEETADYTVQYTSDGTPTDTSFYYYEGDLRASEADVDDRLSKTVQYRGEVDPGTQDSNGDGRLDTYEKDLVNITYFDYEGREKGKEVRSYSERYNSREELVSTTVYLYEASLMKASDPNVNEESRMSLAVAYRGPNGVDMDAALNADGILTGHEGQLDTKTYYRFDGLLKGEEITDYSEKYTRDGNVKNTTIYLYGPGAQRAAIADVQDRMNRNVVYNGAVNPAAPDADNDGLLDGLESKLASITYFDFEERMKGEETADYTVNFNSRQDVTTTVIFYYEDLLRASEALVNDRTSRNVTYSGEIADITAQTDSRGILAGAEDQLLNMTHMHYQGRLKGEEVADYMENFDSSQNVTKTTVYLYEATLERASGIDTGDRMSRSVAYRGALGADTEDLDKDGVIDALQNKLDSVTFFDFVNRVKGEEVVDYSYNYDSTGTTVKTVSIFYYEGVKRAASAAADDALIRQDSHKAGSLLEALGDIATRESSTFFAGEKGEEIADYSYNYKNDGDTVDTVGIFYYEDGGRAQFAESYEAMVRQDTHKAGSVGEVVTANKKSSTFFNIHLGKGSELADYSYTYMSGGVDVKTVGIFYYEGGNRAELTNQNHAMVRQDTHRAGSLQEALDDKTTRRSSTYFNINLGKGEEILDYIYNYGADGEKVTTVSVFN
ncbi:MAG: hypothetical protein PVH45_03785, partial [Candidatus Omnitrophota bacterium]